jgi:hypothetical protein
MRHISINIRLLSALIVLGLVFQFVGPAGASSIVVDLSLNEQDMVVRGEFAHATLGEVSILGDFNNDGYEDLLIGAPASNPEGRKFAGAAYVIMGGPSRPSEINLAATRAGLSVYGANPGDILGHSVAVGDVNGDGINDIIIGADRVNHPNNLELVNLGAVYVFLGRQGGDFFNQNVQEPDQADVIIYGEFNDGRFGRAVTAGDVTGNGIDDLVIGSYLALPGGRNRAGAVYVFQGSNSWTTNQQTVIDLANGQQANLAVYGHQGSAADITTLSTAETKVMHPLLEEEFYILQTGFGDRLGRSVAVGNVNGNGPQDIVAGAYGADVDGRSDAGKTYVIYGSTQYQTAGNVIDLGTGGQANVTINGIAAQDRAGFYVAAGNYNNNQYGDIMIGAYQAEGERGQVYLIHGRAQDEMPSDINLATQATVTINGAAPGDRLGRALSFADISGDGTDDLLIGASRATPNGRLGAGIAYVIYADQTLPGTIHLSQEGSANIRVLGAASGIFEGEDACDASIEREVLAGNCPDELGRAIAAGDFNGDGRLEVVVGALFSNNGEMYNAGAVYIISGASFQGTTLYLPLINRN